MKKFISLIICFIMLFTLAIPAFAVEPKQNDTLPEWVLDGEEWHPATGIMAREGADTCGKGHTCPSGYTYQGYTTGKTDYYYNDVARIFRITSIFTGDPITITVASLTSEFLEYLEEITPSGIDYYRYVYRRNIDGTLWIHTIYVEKIPNTTLYRQITCETWYENVV